MVQLNNSFSGFHLFSVRFGFIIVCHPEHVHASDAICNHISKHTHTFIAKRTNRPKMWTQYVLVISALKIFYRQFNDCVYPIRMRRPTFRNTFHWIAKSVLFEFLCIWVPKWDIHLERAIKQNYNKQINFHISYWIRNVNIWNRENWVAY